MVDDRIAGLRRTRSAPPRIQRRRIVAPLFGVAALTALPAVSTPAHSAESIPRAVEIARATEIPSCTIFVDAGAAEGGEGTADGPYATIAAAVEAAPAGAVICVAAGTYAEEIAPGEKHFTLAGGFQRGKAFRVRDSAKFVSKAQGNGTGSFLKISGDVAPQGDALTVVDGFEITGYSQAIVREFWEPQRFDLTNNYIHGNTCEDQKLAGAAFALAETSGNIKGNVIRNNACGRGGGGFLIDNTNKNTIVVSNNLVDRNSGTESDSAHGGGFYFFVNNLTVTGNLFTANSVTKWGGGLFIGAYTAGGQFTNAKLKYNVYMGNKAGSSGGGFFCDDGASCVSENELYVGNCGGNVLVDGGAEGSGPTTARFDRITSVGALTPDCNAPGIGFRVDTYEALVADTYTISNALFWGNADGQDLVGTCDKRCQRLKVSINHSMLKRGPDQGIKIKYGPNIVPPADPQFVAPDKGDYRLRPGSPAEGKGMPAGTDLGAFPKGSAESATAQVKATAAPPPAAPAGTSADDAEAPASKPAPRAEASSPPPDAGPRSADDARVKEAYDEAKSLGTIAAWRAFLNNFPEGFYADMAGAHLRSLGYEPGSGAPSPLGPAPPAPVPPKKSAAPAEAPAPQADQPSTSVGKGSAAAPVATIKAAPAVKRGAKFFGFPERFNRYYTDPGWKPAATIFAGPKGGGDGSVREKPATLADAVSRARPGTLIYVLRGAYKGGIEFTTEMSGTYDAPIVLFGERKVDNTSGVTVDCAVGDRKTCFNFEGANYIAVDGFELVGGIYGVRAIGLGFAASEHSRGVAILNNSGRDQDRDPFKTAQADWSVIENNLGIRAKKGDGHGIYVSGGSDWGIVRLNETHSNASSDLQINADPASTCEGVGVPYDDPRCDAFAGEGEGGQGASDYFLVEGNYCHRSEVGPNFTSLRRSMIRNNIFGPQTRHNASFWQETDNPKLGSSENRIFNNLFITTKRHALKFENNSGRNILGNNVLLGISIEGGKVTANPSALLTETDATSENNQYHSNVYVSGTFEGRKPGQDEMTLGDFEQSWFKAFPTGTSDPLDGFAPNAGAPFLDKGKATPDVPSDRFGTARRAPSDPGPIEVP